MVVVITVDDTMANARLAKAIKKIVRYAGATTQDMVTIGKEFARIRVPKGKNMWLYKSIKGKTKLVADGNEGIIELNPSIVPKDGIHRGKKGGNYPNFNLARWSHTSAKATKHFKSGSPKFMYETRDFLAGAGMNRARGRWKSIKF